MRIILFFILIIFSIEINAQSNRFLSLDIEHASGTKRIKYYEQDNIIFKLKNDPHKYKGIIVALNDTALALDSAYFILYKDIRKISVDRSNSLTHVASAFITGCGIGYVGLDALNNALNKDKPILRWLDVEIGIGLVAVGQAFRVFTMKHYKMNKKHRLKFIDDTP